MLRIPAALLTVVLLVTAIPLHAQHLPASTPPDSGLYTTYSFFSNEGQITVDWIVCGSTQDSEGCYSNGHLGPFVAVGGILESNPRTNGNVVTRGIYVVDCGSASVNLYVYKKVDTVTSNSDTVTVTLLRTIALPLTGGSTASCSMAANSNFLFIGSDQNEQAVMVQKSNLKVTQVGIYTLGIGVTSITSDQYGYITVTQVGLVGSGFAVFAPNGQAQEDGGGASFFAGTTQAVPLKNLGGATIRTTAPLGYGSKD